MVLEKQHYELFEFVAQVVDAQEVGLLAVDCLDAFPVRNVVIFVNQLIKLVCVLVSSPLERHDPCYDRKKTHS